MYRWQALFICEFVYLRLVKINQKSVFEVFWLSFLRLFAVLDQIRLKIQLKVVFCDHPSLFRVSLFAVLGQNITANYEGRLYVTHFELFFRFYKHFFSSPTPIHIFYPTSKKRKGPCIKQTMSVIIILQIKHNVLKLTLLRNKIINKKNISFLFLHFFDALAHILQVLVLQFIAQNDLKMARSQSYQTFFLRKRRIFLFFAEKLDHFS